MSNPTQTATPGPCGPQGSAILARAETLSTEEIQAYVDRGRRLRARFLNLAARRAASRLRRLLSLVSRSAAAKLAGGSHGADAVAH